MSQTKKNSFLEAIANTLVGFITTVAVSPAIYWICNVDISYTQMTFATVLFTLVSIFRNYVIRRWFNKKLVKTVKA